MSYEPTLRVVGGKIDGAAVVPELQNEISDPGSLFSQIQSLLDSPEALRAFCQEIEKFLKQRAT